LTTISFFFNRRLKSVLYEKHPETKTMPISAPPSVPRSSQQDDSESTVTSVSGLEGASDQIDTE